MFRGMVRSGSLPSRIGSDSRIGPLQSNTGQIWVDKTGSHSHDRIYHLLNMESRLRTIRLDRSLCRRKTRQSHICHFDQSCLQKERVALSSACLLSSSITAISKGASYTRYTVVRLLATLSIFAGGSLNLILYKAGV